MRFLDTKSHANALGFLGGPLLPQFGIADQVLQQGQLQLLRLAPVHVVIGHPGGNGAQ